MADHAAGGLGAVPRLAREEHAGPIATWAFLGPEQSERLKQGIKRLKPADWKSGDELWLMDFIAPFGGQEEALKELKTAVFPGRKMKSLQPGPTGEMAVVEF